MRGSAPLLVNESGFYKLVPKSRKLEARKFQDRVTGEVPLAAKSNLEPHKGG